MSFEKLNIRPELVRGLKEIGIEKPTSIQEKAIPLILSGKDVIGMSKTGSGKTVAFGIPLLEKIIPGEKRQVLIMTPTRELAVQISRELQKFGKYLKFEVATVFGGVAINPQMDQIARSEIIVGTPGRLLDHLNRRTLDISQLKCVVLDEADKMVEMGFIEDIRRIIDYSPKGRQVLLFGATISDEINRLKQQYMTDAVKAKADLHVEKEFLEQYYYNVKMNEKFSLLVHLLNKEKTDRVMIFCSKISTVELLTKNLRAQKIKVEMMHGKLSQNKRLQVIDRFNKDKIDILIASAVAARGLDIKDVSHVINYDLSQDPQEYIHRVGRTARAGESGKAITLLSRQDYDVFGSIMQRYRDLNIAELPQEEFKKLRFETGFSQSRNNYSNNNRRFKTRGFNDNQSPSKSDHSNRYLNKMTAPGWPGN